jgi:hypothetical protein
MNRNQATKAKGHRPPELHRRPRTKPQSRPGGLARELGGLTRGFPGVLRQTDVLEPRKAIAMSGVSISGRRGGNFTVIGSPALVSLLNVQTCIDDCKNHLLQFRFVFLL